MFWLAFILLVMSILCLIGTAVSVMLDSSKGFLICLLFGVFFTVLGGTFLFHSNAGSICDPDLMSCGIYTVSGQLEVTGGTIAALEDSAHNVCVVWAEREDLEMPALPKDAKLAKVEYFKCTDGISRKCLLPVELTGSLAPKPQPIPHPDEKSKPDVEPDAE